MPWGVALFLVYALGILAAVGLSLGFVVDQATNVPVTPLGLAALLFRGLRAPAAAAWLDQP